MRYYIGIDGGGTHSRLLAIDLNGRVVGVSHGKSTNVESNSLTVVKQHFQMLLKTFLDQTGCDIADCAALCFGTAGVDTEDSRRMIECMVDSLNLSCPIRVVNDAEIALFANTQGEPGVMLIAGTGSIGYGSNAQGRTWRVGGFGYILGDDGSAYWVAREGIALALKAFDHSGPGTRMINDFCKALGIREFDMIVDYVYQKNKSDLARLSHVVTSAHEAGDPMATEVMRRALDALTLIVTTVMRELQMDDRPYPLLFGGGFLTHTPWLMRRLEERVHESYPLLRVRLMEAEAQWGAVYMAAQLVGQKIPLPDDSASAIREPRDERPAFQA